MLKQPTPRLRAAAVLALAIVMVAADAWGCPTCKDGLGEADAQGQAVAAGFYYSILFMMAMPFAILSILGGAAYRMFKRAELEREQQAAAAH